MLPQELYNLLEEALSIEIVDDNPRRPALAVSEIRHSVTKRRRQQKPSRWESVPLQKLGEKSTPPPITLASSSKPVTLRMPERQQSLRPMPQHDSAEQLSPLKPVRQSSNRRLSASSLLADCVMSGIKMPVRQASKRDVASH